MRLTLLHAHTHALSLSLIPFLYRTHTPKHTGGSNTKVSQHTHTHTHTSTLTHAQPIQPHLLLHVTKGGGWWGGGHSQMGVGFQRDGGRHGKCVCRLCPQVFFYMRVIIDSYLEPNDWRVTGNVFAGFCLKVSFLI